MYDIEYTTQFKKDFRKAVKRGLKVDLLEKVISLLEQDGKLPFIYKPHKLKGNYAGLWECHIQPDWLLLWDQSDTLRLITLIRTGTHSDMF